MALFTTPAMPSLFSGKENIYAQAENANNEKKEALKLKNDTPLELPQTVTGTLMSTTELAQYFNEILRPIAKDYYGSEVFPDANGNMLVNLTFKAINDGDEENRIFMPIGSKKTGGKQSDNAILNRIRTVNALNSGSNTMGLTPYGAEIIYDLMNSNVRKNVNPDKPETMTKYYGEIKENTGYGITVQNIYNTVVGIDIYRLLNLTFGNTNKKGDRVVRKVNPLRPVVAAAALNARPNYIIEIQTMATKDYEAAMAKIGMTPMPGAITAVTGTITG